MLRMIVYIILTFIIFGIFKFILNLFRRKTPLNPQPPKTPVNKEADNIDKSKIVDADFEELK